MKPQEIQKLRHKLGQTQTVFAQENFGLKRITIAKWESGDRNPGKAALIILKKLAASLLLLAILYYNLGIRVSF